MSFEYNNKENLREKYYGVGSFVLEIVKVFLLAFLIIIPIRVFLFQPFFVKGASMEPTFENNEYLIINEFGYKKTTVSLKDIHFFTLNPFKELKRGDVVVFRYPTDPGQFFIKRIIGLPGEKIQLREGKITVYNSGNPGGFTLNEKEYLSTSVRTHGETITALAKGEYFVLGDNRMFSSDSRAWGPVKEDEIIGKVLLRAWPMDRLTIF